MANLIFRCPQTGRTIESGIVTDPRSLSNVQEVRSPFNVPTLRQNSRTPNQRRTSLRSSVGGLGC